MSNPEWLDEDGSTSIRYRVLALTTTVIVGGLAAILLGATAFNPVIDVPGAPHDLILHPEFDADQVVPVTSFYDTPDPLPNVIPGTLLKSEPIEGAPTGYKAIRLMYVSTAVDGSPIAVTGSYFERNDVPTPTTGRPLLGFSHGTTGLAPVCGISQAPFTSGTTGAQFWRPEIRPLLDAGYVVAATDYQNMGAVGTPSYLVAESEAYAVLDSMRAAVNLSPNSIDGNKMGLIGHSQGGQAAVAAAQYQPEYAPDLAIRGAVAESVGLVVGLPIVTKSLVSSGGGNQASRIEYLTLLTASYAATYPDQMSASDVLTADGLTKMPLAQELCGPPLKDQFDGPLKQYIREDLPNSFLRIANQNVPAGPIIGFPLLMTQGAKDISTVPEFAYADFRAICRTGSVADLRIYPEDDHNSLLWTSMTQSIDWLNERMSGLPAANGCEGRS